MGPIAVEPVEGNNFQVTIEFDAPIEAGSYRSFYRFVMADGKHFGPHIWVDFVVKETVETELTEEAAEDENVATEPAAVESVEEPEQAAESDATAEPEAT